MSLPGRPKGKHRTARPTRQASLPVGTYLLRVVQEQEVRVRLRYEMVELASGQRHHFKSLAALNRHLRQAAGGLQKVGDETALK